MASCVQKDTTVLLIVSVKSLHIPTGGAIDQFWYIKIHPQTIDVSTRLLGINTEFVGFIPQSLVLRSIV